jgi:hypothetical protein
MQTDIHLAFADGTYRFRLTLPMVYELQRKTKVGIGVLFGRVLEGRYVFVEGGSFGMPTEGKYSVEDLIETVRCGLIGGGEGLVNGETIRVNAVTAAQLVETYCFPAAPLKEAWDLAAAILTASIEGYEEPGQKKRPEETDAPTPKRKKAGSTTRSRSATLPSADAIPSPRVN